MIIATVAAALLLLFIFGPQIWARYIFKKYSSDVTWLNGTGGELAEHLISNLPLEGVQLEADEADNNYYDPDAKLIRLSETNFNGRSITAVTVATHEIGHAIQHKVGYKPLYMRTKLAKLMPKLEKVAAMFLVAFPFVSLLTRIPSISLLMVLCGLVILLLPVLFHLCTLPVELDASFKRALPILINGQYIPEHTIPIAKKILTAAALTYVAASLASLLNFYRWLVFLKR